MEWQRMQMGSTFYLWSDTVPPGSCRSQSGLKRSEQRLSASCVQRFVLHPSASSTFSLTLGKVASWLFCVWSLSIITWLLKLSSFSECGLKMKQKRGWTDGDWCLLHPPQELLLCGWRSYNPTELRPGHRTLLNSLFILMLFWGAMITKLIENCSSVLSLF